MKYASYRIAGLYILFGFIWIYFSDKALSAIVGNSSLSPEKILLLNNSKGFIFIFITGLLLFFLLKNVFSNLNTSHKEQRSLFENSPNPMLILNKETFQINDINFAANAFFKMNRTDLLKAHLMQFISKEDVELLKITIKNTDGVAENSGFIEVQLPGTVQFKLQFFVNTISFQEEENVILTLLDISDKLEFEQRISDILENIAEGFIAMDNEYNCLYINKKFEQFFQINRHVLLNRSIWDVFPHVKEHSIHQLMQQSKLSGQAAHFIEYLEPTQTWLYVTLYPTKDGLSAFLQDISAARKSEDVIRRHQQNLNALINATDDLVWSVNPEYCLISANQSFRNSYQAAIGEVVIENQSLLHPKLDEEYLNAWKGYYDRALQGEAFSLELETTAILGDTYYSETHFNPIRNESGTITGIGCVSRNITERKNQELRIRNQNEQLREIAWMQSHTVRAPVANILGLVDLMQKQQVVKDEHVSYLEKLERCSRELDLQIHKIVQKSSGIDLEVPRDER